MNVLNRSFVIVMNLTFYNNVINKFLNVVGKAEFLEENTNLKRLNELKSLLLELSIKFTII